MSFVLESLHLALLLAEASLSKPGVQHGQSLYRLIVRHHVSRSHDLQVLSRQIRNPTECLELTLRLPDVL